MHAQPSSAAVASLEQLLEDQSQRWPCGAGVPVETYLEQHPQLREDTEQVLDLLYHEVLLRTHLGETPTLEEYLERFPALSAQLRDQFEVHQALSLLSTARNGQRLGSVQKPTSSAPRPWPTVSGYEILAELGRGGMGVVYEARQVGLNRLVALKMIRSPALADADQIARFRAEAEAVARLQHPNIIQIHEIGEVDGAPYFSLELATGGSLQDLRGVPVAAQPAAHLLEMLARAVQFAHEHGIVHRDLKPANILLQGSGGRGQEAGVRRQESAVRSQRLHFLAADSSPLTPKITDFGLAKRLDSASEHTRNGALLGTPSYMAPEQAAARPEAVTPAVDVYALGAILYELLTGRPPFRGTTALETIYQVVHQEVVPPRQLQPRVPRDLETICLTCLDKYPARRYASALILAEDLHRYQAGEPIQARPTPVWERGWKWLRRHPALAAASITAILVLATLMVLHDMDLENRLAEARQQTRRHEIREELSQIGNALNAQQWREAQERLQQAGHHLDQLAQEVAVAGDAEELRDRLQRLQGQLNQHQTDADRLEQLTAGREQAVFYALGFAGLEAQASLQKTREQVERVIHVFGADQENNGPLPLTSFSHAQRVEIREGCFELLLDLAHAEAAANDGSPAGVKAANACALETLDRAARLGLDGGLYQARRARYLDGFGRVAEAAQARAAAREQPPRRLFEQFLSAYDLYQVGKCDEAIRLCEAVRMHQPTHFGAHYLNAVCYLKKRSGSRVVDSAFLGSARADLTSCINQRPEYVWPYLLRGLVHGELGEYDAALADLAHVDAWSRSHADEPARYGLLVNRGVVRIRQKKYTQAVQDLNQAVHLRPQEYPAHVDLAEAYQNLQRWPEAAEQLDQALALRPAAVLPKIYRNRALLHEKRGDLAAALHDLDEALGHESPGGSSGAAVQDLYEKGRLLLQTHDYAHAVEAFRAVLVLQPDNLAAQRHQAEALLQLGRFREAIPALDRALDRDAKYRLTEAAIYRARALAHVELGEHAAAAEDYTRALAFEPAALADYLARGWSYIVLDVPSLAVRDFEKALQLDPKQADAYNGRGYARAKLGHYQAGVLDAEMALHLGPASARLFYNAARIYAQAAARVQALPTHGSGDSQAALRFQNRASVLLGQALEALSPERRSVFWQQTVQHDAGLDAIRSSTAFVHLAERYGSLSR
jgi:serine/threonine protein kinase/predicted Zn-dependent protease